jgi:SAM-dependent methyltransferase
MAPLWMIAVIRSGVGNVDHEDMLTARTPRSGPAQSSAWNRPQVVEGFARSTPNQELMAYARRHRCPWFSTRVLDIGCGAGRNAVPLACDGFDVIGIDLSRPMLTAASRRDVCGRIRFIESGMDDLPIRSQSTDLIVAHGIWNLARSDDEFRLAVAEASRVAAPGAALFVFTFSRHTLPAAALPVAGQQWTFSQFSGEPQIFLTREQLVDALAVAGFAPDADLPLRELNVPPPGQLRLGGPPVIFEGGFRFVGK